MRQKRFWFTMSGILAVLAVALMLPGQAVAAGTYKILHTFRWAKNPMANLTFDAAGNLYGTTNLGGGSGCGGIGCGVVWKLKPNANGTWTVSILHVFKGPDGDRPFAGLVFDAAGINLYGTTAGGGADGFGTVFKLAPNPDGTWTESVLYSFTCCAGGLYPYSGLVFDTAGNLYGRTDGGGTDNQGVVFKLKPNPDGTWTERVLYNLQGNPEQGVPGAGLIFDAAGNLFGTTYDRGADGFGTVFELKPNGDGTWTESVLYSFTGGADGGFPRADLVFDTAGNLYSTTDGGGADGFGTVFELKPNGDGTWTESVLYSFTGRADGGEPFAGLVFDAAGINLYGTTGFRGGSGCGGLGCGVVFKPAPTSSGWKETVLHRFSGFGQGPLAPVIFDPAGNLYGTTSSGNTNYGLIFKITP
jgi:uncharacterized repeat protein (TIGR03803 family)